MIAGETTTVKVNINNDNCEYALTSYTIELWQYVISNHFNVVRKVMSSTLPGVLAGQSQNNIEVPLFIPLTYEFQTSGKLLTNLESQQAKQVSPTVSSKRDGASFNVWYTFKMRVEHEKGWKTKSKCEKDTHDITLFPYMKEN